MIQRLDRLYCDSCGKCQRLRRRRCVKCGVPIPWGMLTMRLKYGLWVDKDDTRLIKVVQL